MSSGTALRYSSDLRTTVVIERDHNRGEQRSSDGGAAVSVEFPNVGNQPIEPISLCHPIVLARSEDDVGRD